MEKVNCYFQLIKKRINDMFITDNLLYLAIGLVVLLLVLLIARTLVWWYFGVYEILDRLDKNNNLLTDIREILKKSTNVEIIESNVKEEY